VRATFSRNLVTEDAVQGGGGTLLGSISDFCRRTGMAESTFGRRAVNDGKFVARLRDGARVTPETLTRVNDFMAKHGAPGAGDAPPELMALIHAGAPQPAVAPAQKADPETNFRFFDNRQKYLLFVNTCSEKDVIARRVGLELGQIHPRPPAVRLFDAGMGDGTVLARVMREMHRRFPTVPFYIVGKEISLEDVRLSLRKMADRFFEHPATVLVVTNMYYSEAPWLQPRAVSAATSMVWHEAALTGTTSHDFSEQIATSEEWTKRLITPLEWPIPSFFSPVNSLVRTLADIREVFCEFQKRDIQIKDLERGLIDFPAIIGGKEVFLCWEQDEDDIEFWHDLDSGYAGRERL